MKLRAHSNVVSLDEERRLRAQGEDQVVMFIGFKTREPEPSQQAAPEGRLRSRLIRAMLGLGKRSRPYRSSQ